MSDDQHNSCESIIHQLIKVQAQVTITPLVKHGKPKIYCIDSEIKPEFNYDDICDLCYKARRESEKTDGKCHFTVSQVLCIEVPIAFDVDIDVNQGIICCGKPDFGSCNPPCDDQIL